MREASTRYVLLGVLATAGPLTGFDIRAFLDHSVSYFWRESYGQIYPELKRLADEGLIEDASPGAGAREARPWRITRAGRAALKAWLDRPPQPAPVRDELLLKLFFSRHAPSAAARALIARAKDSAEARGVEFEAAEAQVLSEPEDPDLLGSLLTLERGRIMARAQQEWCARAAAFVEAWESGGAEALIRRWRKKT